LDEVEAVARRIGAVNTITVESDGKWIGYNTDYQGFLKPLRPFYPVIRSCLLAGAGGAARAVAFALCDLPAMKHLCLMNRTPQKGLTLKNDLQAYKALDYQTATPGEKTVLKQYDLLVNATPLGMGELTGRSPFDPTAYAHSKTIVYDLIYNPRETLFLEQAKAAGLTTINGWPMLLGQAEAAFRIWTGQKFTDDLMDKIGRVIPV